MPEHLPLDGRWPMDPAAPVPVTSHMHDVEPALVQQILHLQENIRPIKTAWEAGPVEAIEEQGVAMPRCPCGN